jgi:RNA recognition motif-containing protein
MAIKLYVGNLAWGTTTDSLKAGFSSVAPISDAIVMIDKMTNRSRGFGFVTCEDADAAKLIEAFDGKDFEGRQIKVNEAKPLEERPPRREFRPRN